MKKSNAEINMLSGPLLGPLLRFSLPLMLTSVLQLLYNAADIIVVGRFAGSAALAAVGSTSTVSNLIITLLIGLSVGAGVVVAQRWGADRQGEVEEAVHTSMLLSLLGGLAFAALGYGVAYPVLRLMNSPPDVIDGAALYMRIFFLGMPANMAFNFAASILRAVGDTRRPLIYLSVSGVVNVLLNLLLVIRFEMGVAGVALATVASQVLSAALTVTCLMRSSTCVRLSLRRLRLVPRQLREILRIGIPAGLQSTLFSFSNTLIQSTVNTFGSAVIAGCAAAGSIEGFVYVCENAFATAATTFTGQNVGARRFDRLRRVLGISMLCAGAISLAAGALACLFSAPLLRLYTTDAAAIAAGRLRLLAICMFYPLCGSMDTFSGSLRGMGCSTLPMVISLSGSCLLRLLWLATFFRLCPTILMLYAIFPISWTVTSLLYVFAYRRVESNLIRSGAVDGWGRGIQKG